MSNKPNTLKTDYTWFRTVQEFSGISDLELANLIACFFMDRNLDNCPVALPTWANTLEGEELLNKQQTTKAEYGWNEDMSLLGIMHLEFLARQDYKDNLHEQFVTAIESLAKQRDHMRLLDFGCGMSSFGQIALSHFNAACVFADVDPETLKYLQFYCDKKWPGRVVTQPIPRSKNSLSMRSRVGIDHRVIKGPFDIVIAADVLEHTLNPLEILLYLVLQVRPGGFLFINYPNFIEGDWHTPEASYLRKYCMGFLHLTAVRQNHCVWRRKGSFSEKLLYNSLRMVNPLLQQRARSFAKRYFRKHGNELVNEVQMKAKRTITIEQLIDSV